MSINGRQVGILTSAPCGEMLTAVMGLNFA